MNFLLDANIYFSILSNPKFFDRHRVHLLRIAPRTFLSSVVRAELIQGAKGDLGRARIARATRQLERARRVVAPTHEDWVAAGTIQGRIWDDNPSLRTKRLLNDILIACSARRVGAIVVSENKQDFELIGEYLPLRSMPMAELALLLAT